MLLPSPLPVLQELREQYTSRPGSRFDEYSNKILLDVKETDVPGFIMLRKSLVTLTIEAPQCVPKLQLNVEVASAGFSATVAFTFDLSRIRVEQVEQQQISYIVSGFEGVSRFFRQDAEESYEALEAVLQNASTSLGTDLKLSVSSVIVKTILLPSLCDLSLVKDTEPNVLFFLTFQGFKDFIQGVPPHEIADTLLHDKGKGLVLVSGIGGGLLGPYVGIIDPGDTDSCSVLLSRFARGCRNDFTEVVAFYSSLTVFDPTDFKCFPELFRLEESTSPSDAKVRKLLSTLETFAVLCTFSGRVRLLNNKWQVQYGNGILVPAELSYDGHCISSEGKHLEVDYMALMKLHDWASRERLKDKMLLARKSMTLHGADFVSIIKNLVVIRGSAEAAYESFLEAATRSAIEFQRRFVESAQSALAKDYEALMKLDEESINGLLGGLAIALTGIVGWIVRADDPTTAAFVTLSVPGVLFLYLLLSIVRLQLLRGVHDRLSAENRRQLEFHKLYLAHEFATPYIEALESTGFPKRCSNMIAVLVGLLFLVSFIYVYLVPLTLFPLVVFWLLAPVFYSYYRFKTRRQRRMVLGFSEVREEE